MAPFDSGTKRWICVIPISAQSAAEPAIEYKVAIKRGSRDGSEQEWEWQPGPNRAATVLPGTPSTTPATQYASWYVQMDGTRCVTHPTEGDPYLEPFQGHLRDRYRLYTESMAAIDAHGGGMDAFSRSYERYGFNRVLQEGIPGIQYREWAPGAHEASLIGDFNGWDVHATPCTKDEYGTWSVFLPDKEDGSEAIKHDSWIKLSLVLPDGSRATRVPAWIRYACYDPNLNELVGKYWNPAPNQRHAWKHPRPYTFEAADYSRVPGMPHIPCRTDWTGTVGPREVSVFGLAKGVGPDGKSPAPSPSASPSGAGDPAGHRRGRTGMESVSVNALRKAYQSEHQAAQALQAAQAGTAGAPAGAAQALAGSSHVRRPSPTQPDDVASDPAHSGLRIYEAHVGMSSSEGKVATYRHFADNILPRIKKMGYNCVQLMAIMEHAYYGSFGYHVNQFLAPSSRFGTPEDLKYLVDCAHGMGMIIIMDCVHSHASKNVNDGLNRFDGTDHHYFHAGPRGNHDLWDSRLFDYSKLETQRLLLSSLRMFVDEFR